MVDSGVNAGEFLRAFCGLLDALGGQDECAALATEFPFSSE